MSTNDVTAIEQTDPELISRVRDGDVAAYGTLFSRHVDAATRLARVLVGGSDADDLVSGAFVKVLNVLLGGGGPDVAFRAYLLTAVRRLHIDKVRSNQRLTTTDDLTPFDPGVPFTDTAVAGFEGGAAAKAFASLPERWQMVLWHLEVENQKPADIAPLLGMSANSVSALAYRAREGLRQAFLNMHSGDLVSDACRETNTMLGGYVRAALSRRDATKVEEHLEHCRRCTAAYLELTEVNSSLAALLGPALLGAAWAAYASGGGAAATGLTAGILVAVGRGRDAVLAHTATSAATAAVVGIAGITAIAIVNRGPNEKAASAEPPATALVAPSVTPSPQPKPTTSPGRADKVPSETSDRLVASSPDGVAQPAAGTASSAQDNQRDDTGQGNQGGLTPGTDPNQPGSDGTSHPNPTHNPDPTTDPDPDPTDPDPTDPDPTDPDPTNPDPDPTEPPTPPASRVNVGVRAWLAYNHHGRAKITVQVTGVPPGKRVRLTANASTGDIHNHNFGCHRSGKGYTCTASALHSLFFFEVNGHSKQTVRFYVAPPAGSTDRSPRNNSATVQVRGDDEHPPKPSHPAKPDK